MRSRLESRKARLRLVIANCLLLRIFEITGFEHSFDVALSPPEDLPMAPAIGWREREARGRGLLREMNDRIAALAETWDSGETTGVEVSFGCECGELRCIEQVHLSRAAYEEIRTSPRRYLIALNHEDPEVEVAIGTGRDHVVVETLAGNASKIPEETDPRRRASFLAALAVRRRRGR